MPEQFGFRTKHSTQHQFLWDKEFFSETFNAKKLFFDIFKVFDKVWHENLIYNLFGLMSHLDLHIIHFYLGNQNFYVSTNNTLAA